MIRHGSIVAIALVLNATPLFGQSPAIPAAGVEFVVKKASADVYKSPSVAGQIIGTTPAGTVLEIRRNLGSWVAVPWPGSETGIAFLHVNTGTIAPRSQAARSDAQAAVAQIAAVAAAATAATSASANARADQPVAMRQATSPSATYVSLPSHRIGMGALMHASQPRFGATARTWWGNRLGAQFNFARPQLESADGQSVPSTQFAPSLLYSLPDGVVSNVWLRPYLGGGPRFYRANLETQLGYEALGGAEATFAGMPQMAVSVDVGYRLLRPSFNGFEPRQIGYSVLAHWYVK